MAKQRTAHSRRGHSFEQAPDAASAGADRRGRSDLTTLSSRPIRSTATRYICQDFSSINKVDRLMVCA